MRKESVVTVPTTSEYETWRVIVPSEPMIDTEYLPGGVSAEVARETAALHVGLHDGGVKPHVVPKGRSAHENWTLWADPEMSVATTVVEVEPPGATEPEAGSSETEKSNGGGGGGGPLTVKESAALRNVMPSVARMDTVYVPLGVSEDVASTRPAVHVGEHDGGVNVHEPPGGRSAQE